MQPTFSNAFVHALPADPSTDTGTRQVHQAVYAFVRPTPVSNPKLLLCSPETANLLGMTPERVGSPEFTAVLAGNDVGAESKPYATVYGGHQFGHWAGQLGDGRAINLGEIAGYTLQLKGAGPTPFSRHADGRAVLRSSIREFLCSEAMFHLGIPSTRALSLVGSESLAVRDMFYDGHARQEACAVVCRVSESFLRFGHFELPASRGEIDVLRQLADVAIGRHFPDIDPKADTRYSQFFDAVCQSTARLLAGWMGVGFVHGVMNTDNMSILGESIDYGPYGWLEKYELQWTPNTTDAEGRRYSYGNQPAIAQWNLARLANALMPLIHDVEPLQNSLTGYNQTFHAHWNRLLAAKLGLDENVLQTNPLCYQQLVHVLSALEMDFNLFFDALTRSAQRGGDTGAEESESALLACSYHPQPEAGVLRDWLALYRSLIDQSELPDRAASMRAANPVFILRNHLVQDVIEAAEQGNLKPLQEIFTRLKTPYADSADDARWVKKCPPESMHRAGCSMLSCSS
ncbi:MAG: YdiU family protein [Arenimonas sp.]|nr:YdiU family protein [Arenimonas sp.]